MNRQLRLGIILFLLTLGLTFSAGRVMACGGWMMDGGMMGGKMQDMQIVHQLFANHSLIRRTCLLYTSPSPRDRTRSRMPSSA